MKTELTISGKERLERWFLPSLAIATFAIGIPNAVLTLLAVDIAKTFFGSANPVAVGTVSQLSTLNATAEIAFAILLGILAAKFRHKPLLLVGITLVIISTIGIFLAPNFFSMQLFLCVEDAGSIIVTIIAFTLIGDLLPIDKKAKAISYIVSVSALATLVVILFVGLIANVGGWRYDFVFLALPVSAAALILVMYLVPSGSLEHNRTRADNHYFGGFKQILMNKSAAACLIASALTVAGTQVAIFAIAFYRIQFAVPRELTAGIYEVAVIIFIVAPLISGRIVKRFGAKRTAVVSTFLAAFFTMTFFFVSNLWLVFVFDMLHVWSAATSTPAFVYLVLEQVPKSRGAMMSLNTLFNNLGNVLAPALGGALLAFSSGIYGVVGLGLGSIAAVGAVILLFLVKDTTKTVAKLQLPSDS